MASSPTSSAPPSASSFYADFPAADVQVLDACARGEVAALYEQIHRSLPLAGKRTAAGSAGASSAALPLAVSQHLTIVVTTSPVISNPSTKLIEHLLRSMHEVPGLRDCAVLIMCDGYKVIEDERHRLHGKVTNKRGRVTPEGAAKYEEFKQRLKALCVVANKFPEPSAAGEETTPSTCEEKLPSASVLAEDDGSASSAFKRCTVVPMATHHGFGYLVKAALRLVRTEFVLVAQHDWVFLRGFDLEGVIKSMKANPETLKYIGLPCSRGVDYLKKMQMRYPRLDLPKEPLTYGLGTKVVPMLFWFDKTHIARADHYREFVLSFAARQAAGWGKETHVRRGNFIEDTFGQAELADIKSNGIAAHAKYGNFLLVEMEAKGKQGEVPVPVIYHRNGRRFLLPSQAQAVFNITDAQREARGQFFDPTGRLLDHLQKKKLNVQRLNEQGRTFDECHPQEFDNCKNGLSSASTHKPPPPPVATGGETPQVHFLSPPKCVQVFKVTLGRLTLCDYNSACQLAKEGQTLPMEQQEWAATYFQFGAAHTLGTVPYRWEDRQGQKAAAEATLVRATFEEGTLQIALLEGNFFHDAGVTSMDKAAKAKQLLGLPSEIPLMQSLAARNLVMLVREYADIGALDRTGSETGAGDEKNHLIWELVVPHQLLTRLVFSEEPIARFTRHRTYPLTDRFCLCQPTSPGFDGKLGGAASVHDGPWMLWEEDRATGLIPDCDVAWIDTTARQPSSNRSRSVGN